MGTAGVSSCAEFSASKASRPAGAADVGELHVKGNRQRLEVSSGPHAGQVIIVRPDLGKVWYITPSTRSYEEYRGDLAVDIAGHTLNSLKRSWPTLRAVGVDRVGGYQCDKFEAVTKTHSGDARITVYVSTWFSRKLGLRVKTVTSDPRSAGDVVTELRNIRECRQPDRLFNLPSGYMQTTPSSTPRRPSLGQRVRSLFRAVRRRL